MRLFFSIPPAISEAVTKHNVRDPGRSILYLNFGATDTTQTNEKCSFWHFRFDSNIDMKLTALTAYMAGQKNVRRVYLIKLAAETGLPATFYTNYAYRTGTPRAFRKAEDGRVKTVMERP